jgi:hypothetical protein
MADLAPEERNVRRHRLTAGLVLSGHADHLTAAQVKALVMALDAALDSDRDDHAAPPLAVWPDRCEVRNDG